MILEEKFETNQKNENKRIIIIVLLALVVRILFLLTVSDIKNLNYYEYGEIVKNVQHGNGYSLFYFENDSLKIKYKPGEVPFKSAYMPPGYSMFLYPFFFIQNELLRNIFILLIQIIISSLNIFLLYKLTSLMFSKITGIIASIIYALLPEFIYASANINIVTFFHTGILFLFYLLIEGKIFASFQKLASFIIVILFLIYLRFEFLIFILLLSILIYNIIGIKKLGIIYLSILIMLSPWLIRNYFVFNQFPLLSTSTGLNLYRGHNEYYVGNWGDKNIVKSLSDLQNKPDYEIEASRLFTNKAIDFIIMHPEKEVVYSIQKLFHLWVMNVDDKRTDNLFYKLPSLLILLSFLLSLVFSFSFDKHKYFYVFFIFFSIISVVFFALPRYQTMMKIALIPFAAQGVFLIWHFLKSKFK